jgi:hypothetical protein
MYFNTSTLLVEAVQVWGKLNQRDQQLGFLSFLFYLKMEEDPASETL